MITVFHANKFGDNTKGYTKVAEIDVDTINEAYALTNNVNGSWSRGPELEYDGKKFNNDDYDLRIKLTTDLITNKRTGQVMGLRSTSSGDVIYDGSKYWFLVPMGAGRTGPIYKTHGDTVAIDNFDINGFIYNEKEVA